MNKLFIIGTPIGNIKDITLRAIETLENMDVIACEDTRVTIKLLKKYNIENKKLISYHDKNEKNSSKGIIELIKQNKKIGLVSDAGMPVISDPGYELIRQAIKNEIDIEVIPGVSATTTALVLSNFDARFKFHGFMKVKSGQRINQLKKMENGTHIFFVSPHRLIAELESIKEGLGEKTNVFLAKELTKMYENHYRGTIKEVIEEVKKEKIKGEFTIVIEVKKKKENKYDRKQPV